MSAALYLLAFCSGAAALVYQVVWSKLLAVTFGSTTLAVSAVVAGFMGGMGLGAWLYHRVNERVRAPLWTYGALEVGIALSAAAMTAVFFPLPHVFARLASEVPPGLASHLLRLVTVFVLLLVPAALMGATYPALCTVLIHSRRDVDRHLGPIYGLNTVGAAAGALLAGFVLVEALGLGGSVLVANAINLSIGAVALALARRETRRVGRAGPPTVDEPLPSALPLWLTGAVLFLSGLATLGYEIVWFRAIRYIVGNSTYALTDVLVVFLLGLGFGALLYRPVVSRLGAERGLGWSQLGIAALALAAMAGELWILTDPALLDRFSIFSLAFRARPWPERLVATAVVALLVMLPATLFMGLSFPIASRLFLGHVRALGRRVGGAYLLANLGSIVGSVGAALLVLPWLGTVGGTRALASVNVALGLLVLSRTPGARVLPAAVVAGGIAWAALALPSQLPFQGGVVARAITPVVLFQEEGDLATVRVRATRDDRSRRAMTIDGTVIAVSRGVLPELYAKQVFLAHLPMALDRTIRTTLNVGLASGSTLSATAGYPHVETLDAVEINAAVVRAARFFEEARVLEDPRANLVVEDALHHLLRTRRRYDLVISDGKQNEDFSGNAWILSREFYEFSLARLSPCGLFIQWMPPANLPFNVQTALRTLLTVFPEVEVFFQPPNSIFMVGSRCPIAGRPGLSRAELEALPAWRDYTESGIDGPEALLATWIASGRDLQAVLPDGPLNTVNHPVLEFSTYRASPSLLARGAENLELLLGAREQATPEERARFAPPGSPAAERVARLQRAYLLDYQGRTGEAMRLVRDLLRERPSDPGALAALMRFQAGI